MFSRGVPDGSNTPSLITPHFMLKSDSFRISSPVIEAKKWHSVFTPPKWNPAYLETSKLADKAAERTVIREFESGVTAGLMPLDNL